MIAKLKNRFYFTHLCLSLNMVQSDNSENSANYGQFGGNTNDFQRI